MDVDFNNEIWREVRKDPSIELSWLHGGTLGHKDSNGTWHGLVGAVVLNRTDIVINILALDQERMDVVDYLSPIWNDKYEIFYLIYIFNFLLFYELK
ncbi:hypothetical protein ANN_21229 [Periplaneta americana]|uniref:Ionotropic glutamate receptor L-glutamate and glycine-binding domain-containing protein n=1 Tax=Periplaneta americana TaxID=6978 RepID=A0ABQ8SFY4_PERAM|nr:hypothetical protein ANN_21229 [Periplaneta americana]